MARSKSVWGIDIGQCALKALKLRNVDGAVQVEALDVVEHAKILSEPEADRAQLIRTALNTFLSRNSISGSEVAISVPGQSTFSRFVKLPPVESKRVPDIVRFEAEQQIPFAIADVIWRWQMFRDPDSPDVEVGIFAMKKVDVAEMLSHYNQVRLAVDRVQIAPLALYNFMVFDQELPTDGATLLVDVGADKSDLVIADRGRLWTRTIQIGGNNFTEALVRAFKLPFDKAENLKRTAASSKYARQVFQSMRPVFADLVQEIQRSIGFYMSVHRDSRLKKLIGLGNGFRLPGLQKFMEQNLNLPVVRIDSFNKLAVSPSVSAPTLNENVLSCGVAYGLALQGLNQAAVATNLLPEEIIRKRLWNRKRLWFVAAAVLILGALFCPGYRANEDSKVLANRSGYEAARGTVEEIDRWINRYNELKGKGDQEKRIVESRIELFAYRDFWPETLLMIDRSIETIFPQQPLLGDYARVQGLEEPIRKAILGQSPASAKVLDEAVGLLMDDRSQQEMNAELARPPAEVKALVKKLAAEVKDPLDAAAADGLDEAAARQHARRLLLARKLKQVEAFKALKRNTREVLIAERVESNYLADLGLAAPGAAGGGDVLGGGTKAAGKSGYRVVLTGRTPLPQEEANRRLSKLLNYAGTYSKWLSSASVADSKFEFLPSMGPERAMILGRPTSGPVDPDPLMPTESKAEDTRIRIVWFVEAVGNGVTTRDVKAGGQYELVQKADLLPELGPADPLEAVKGVVELPPKSTITVLDAAVKVTGTWYRVRAADAAGKTLEGWLSAESLDRQPELHEKKP